MSRNFSALMALVGFVVSMPSHAAADGKAIYQKNCAACHMATGKGIPGAFPALAGNTFVQGPSARLFSGGTRLDFTELLRPSKPGRVPQRLASASTTSAAVSNCPASVIHW